MKGGIKVSHFTALIRNTDFSGDKIKDLMRRAKDSAGGEGTLTFATVRGSGMRYAIFTDESHRAAFVVALRRHSVVCELLEGVPPGFQPKASSSSSSGESELAAALGKAMTVIIETLLKK